MEISQWIQKDQIVNVSPAVDGDDWFASQVVEVGNRSFFIALPSKMNIGLSSLEGREIRVSAPTKDGLAQFTCTVLAEDREPVARAEVEFPKEVIHLERRAFQRLPIQMETQYAEIRGGSGGLLFSRSKTLDISGGGLRLETNRVCPQETLLRVKFQIPLGAMEEELILTGRIVRSVPGEGAQKSQAGVEFIDITSHQQEMLVQYVFDRSKEKGLQA